MDARVLRRWAATRGVPGVALAWLAMAACACASAPPPPPPAPSYEEKLAWILRLEDARILREPAPSVPAVLAPGQRATTAPPEAPDLTRLLGDGEARVRRRAALAIGRVGLVEGVGPLVSALGDPEPEVRQMAAFALGLIGDRSAAAPLRTALGDAAPIVRGRAAEALGLIGDEASAAAIGTLVAAEMAASAVAGLRPDEAGYPLDPRIEVFRLGVFALARLGSFEALGGAVLGPNGEPLVRWWPVAFALGRLREPRAAPALLALLGAEGTDARAFAAAGLGAIKERRAVDRLLPLAEGWSADPRVAVAAIRALGEIGDERAAPLIARLAGIREVDPGVRVEAVTALGALGAAAFAERVVDLVTDRWPPLRAAALRSLRAIDADAFLLVLSGLDPDPHWSVRAAVASVLGTLDPAVAGPRLTAMLRDADPRVLPAVLGSLAKTRGAGAEAVLLDHLKHDDPFVRVAAAASIGELKLASGPGALVDAYRAGLRDATYAARAAALSALARYGSSVALPALRAALDDKDWAVRVRAAALVRSLDPAAEIDSAIRPAPLSRTPSAYGAPALVSPAVSPHLFIETDRGTIEVELAVLDAPLTCDTFVALVRRGFFDGVAIHRVVPNFVVQDGDPRGDGEGGPGFTIRDERNQIPYLRGTVGMALDWPDTGGSQFFITHGPQPHLDARYTAFGRVVAGIDVVDRLRQWDLVRRVRVWDGTAWE